MTTFESEFLEWIFNQSQLDPAAVPVGPGDDCAVVTFGGEKMLMTTDQVLEGVHFRLSLNDAKSVGEKALNRSLSDIAAMAGTPVAAVATVALGKRDTRNIAEAIYLGLRGAGVDHGCGIVGGDVASWKGKLCITTTVIGKMDGIDPILRSGAESGDAICVTGRLGGAWKSGRDMTFTPRIKAARILAEKFRPNSMIDISDGFAIDLSRICLQSGVGAEVLAGSIPIHPDAAKLDDELSPLECALTDGEDYELLFTLPEQKADELIRVQPLGVKVTKVGKIVTGEDMHITYPDDRREILPPAGWEH